MPETILSVSEAAKALGKSPAALRNGYKRWGIPHFKLGGQIKFTKESISAWIQEKIKEDTPKEKAHHAS